VNQVKGFQAGKGKKKVRRHHDMDEESIPNPSQCKPLNLYDKLLYYGNNLHHQ
jgi:hypothetical protein